MVRSEFDVTNFQCDVNGRVVIFDVCGLTVGNLYLPSGNDPMARAGREEYAATILPSSCSTGGIVAVWVATSTPSLTRKMLPLTPKLRYPPTWPGW